MRRRRDGGGTYVLAGSVVGLGPKKSVRNNLEYIISKYILTDIFCIEKCRDREEAFAITDDML